MPKKILGQIWLALTGLAFLVSCTQQYNAEPVHLQGRTMGTTYNIKIVAAESFDEVKLQEKIDQLLVQVNQQMSTYIPDSELSLFNSSNSLDGIKISDGLKRVVEEAIRLGQLSNGKLDVTIGPLVNLWGFGPEHRPEVIPTDAILNTTKQRIGLDKLSLNGSLLSKSIPDLYVDLSTIAKGYGVDVVADFIESQGFVNYLVEIGGEMRLKGTKQSGQPWHVAIEKPVSNERVIQQIIAPQDNAVATSGDYRIYFEDNGVRYSHIIDPHTGKPIDHKLVSVTVIHPSSMTADGLSTAMMVMGAEKAYEFAKQHNLAVYLISKTDDGFKEQATVQFKLFLENK